MRRKPAGQRGEAIADPYVNGDVFREPIIRSQFFEPEVQNVADPARVHIGRHVHALRHHSGRPAMRRDSARLAASAGYLKGCFVMKWPTEKSGFMARHSAALSWARSMSASRAWQPAM